MNRTLYIIISRCIIVLLWTIVIIGILYLPHAQKQVFGERRTINVLTWPDLVDRKMFSRFEQETGIQVNPSYFEINDEVISKLSATGGDGYDLVITSDYVVDFLRKKELLQPFDQSKLDFWENIEPHMLGHYYDPENKYAIPYIWDIYGIGYSKPFFYNVKPLASWQLIFDPLVAPKHITIIDDEIELTRIGGQYLFGLTDDLDREDRLQKIKELFIQQQPFIETYSEMRGDYLLASGTSPVVITQSAYIWQAMQQNNTIDFLIPQEGSFIAIDSLVIPRKSKNQDDVHKFINFLFTEEPMMRLRNKRGFLLVLRNHLEQLDLDYLGGLSYLLNPKRFKQFQFFTRVVPQEKISAMWIEIKSY